MYLKYQLEMKNRISITIPNYNKCTELSELLHEIEKVHVNGDFIIEEVFISDNASDIDEYKKLLVVIEGLETKIRIHRQEENIGFQKNLLFCLASVIGDYVLLLGSDDGIDTSKFSDVFSKIIKENKDIYILNRNICDESLNVLRRDSYMKEERDYNFSKENEIQTYFSESKSVNAFGCFISTLVLSKKFRHELIEKSKKTRNWEKNLFPHIYLIWELMSEGGKWKGMYLNDLCINWRSDNSSFGSTQVDKCFDIIGSGLETNLSRTNKKIFLRKVFEFYKIRIKTEEFLRSKPKLKYVIWVAGYRSFPLSWKKALIKSEIKRIF